MTSKTSGGRDNNERETCGPVGPLKVATQAVHAGQHELGLAQFPVPPLVTNSAILLESVEQGWDMLTNERIENFAYQRYANPTVSILEGKFSSLEGSTYSLALNSGMAACVLLFRTMLKCGDHVIVQHGLYHEITDQLKFDSTSCGIEISMVEEYSIAEFETNIKDNTKLVFVESPTNPSLDDVDIRRLAAVCRLRNVILVVDNTLLTPLALKPLRLGAHLSLYSTTKHINGHGDAVGGFICTDSGDLYTALKSYRDNSGMILDPFSAWLTIRGLRTLPLRLERHAASARRLVAVLLKEFPEVQCRVPWNSKYHAANEVDMRFCSGIVSLVFNSRETALIFVRNLRLIRLGTTFGNLESLCYHFGGFARPSRDITKIGIPLGLVRLSIGIEDADDIIADVRRSLNVVLNRTEQARDDSTPQYRKVPG